MLDVELGGGPTGFDLADALRTSVPDLPIVFLTNLPDPRFAERTSEGLPTRVAYLRKTDLDHVDVLADTLDAALRGRDLLPRHDRKPDRPLAELTRKQIEVMRLVAEGRSNAGIAEERGITVKAVEDTISRACAALGIDTKSEGNARVAAARRFLEAMRGAQTPGS